jgi:acetyl esterase/lipase
MEVKMTLSLRARFWRAFLRKSFKEKPVTIAENRIRSAKNGRLLGRAPKGFVIEKFEAAGLHCAWIRPARTDRRKVVLHLHGGGYVTGSIESYLMMCIPMAQTLGLSILLPEYRLAPEHPFPAALEDAQNIYHWLLAQGYQPGEIIISGDSAGGGLALATILALRDAGQPLPAGIVCISPWVDLMLSGHSHITQAKSDPILTTSVLREWAHCYGGEEKLDNPLISPVYANFRDFPPLLIQVGSEEILLDDARMLAEIASGDGVMVEFKIWAGLWHVWHVLGNLIPESQPAFREIGEFIQAQFSAQAAKPD